MQTMATNSDMSKGVRRRTMIPRVKVGADNPGNMEHLNNRAVQPENGKDSGLSSDNTTPTGSPPPRQQKLVVPPLSVVNSLVAARVKSDAARIGSARTSRLLRSRSGTDSPRSQDSVRTRQIASPFRPVLTGNGQSPSLESGEEGSPRLDRLNYHQDIVSIKTGLLKLMRVVQESGEKDLTRAETLNPFTNPMVNGLFPNLNEDGTTETSGINNGALNVADELADLRRQVIFLQGQLQDNDRTIQQLQLQVIKQQELISSTDSPNSSSSTNGNSSFLKDTCNAATQTEKIRPLSAGPSLLQSLPQDGSMGPLVSWSESWNYQNSTQQSPSLVELNSSKSPRKLTERSQKLIKVKADNTNRTNEDIKLETNKSGIPSLKKLTPTFIPRANGRLHNS